MHCATLNDGYDAVVTPPSGPRSYENAITG
jgi:hypothetical protein